MTVELQKGIWHHRRWIRAAWRIEDKSYASAWRPVRHRTRWDGWYSRLQQRVVVVGIKKGYEVRGLEMPKVVRAEDVKEVSFPDEVAGYGWE